MRLCVDATPLLLRSAGVKTYVYEWTRALRRECRESRLSLFPFLGFPERCVHDQSAFPPLFTRLRLAGLLAVNNPVSRKAPLLNAISGGIDVFHCSQNLFAPPGRCRITGTIYDMTCWLFPEMHTRANVRGARAFAERVVKKAAGLIAISENSRRDAAHILGLDPEKIEVIHSGVAEAFFEATPADTAAARARWGLEKPYILFVGTIEPRKNVSVLLDAYDLLPASLRDEFQLVLAGPSGWKQEAVLGRIQDGGGNVRYLGYVPETDLPALTAGAAVFAYPSLYEGFGLPVAQAMAAGAPVITSNLSSLPELTGEAGIQIDPRSPGELAAALQRVLLSETVRDRMREAGRKRAENFRWERVARQSWAFFEKVAGQE